MRETRQAILEIIRRRGSVTIQQLAEELGLSPVTVRHHLYALLGDGLIARVPLRHGVGRPEHGYSLTEAGERRFPNRYHTLTAHLLSVLKHMKSEADLQRLLEGLIRQTLAVPPEVDTLPPHLRLLRLEEHLRRQGIPIDITFEAQGEEACLHIRCPFSDISQQHPELCRADEQVIGEALKLPLQRAVGLPENNQSCNFSIKLNARPMRGEALEKGVE